MCDHRLIASYPYVYISGTEQRRVIAEPGRRLLAPSAKRREVIGRGSRLTKGELHPHFKNPLVKRTLFRMDDGVENNGIDSQFAGIQ